MAILKWSKLTAAQKEKAWNQIYELVMRDLIERGSRPYSAKVNALIDEAIETAEAKRTPWFAHEYIMEVVGDVIKKDLEKLAKAQTYSTEPVIRV